MKSLSKKEILIKVKDGQITSKEAMYLLKKEKNNKIEPIIQTFDNGKNIDMQSFKEADIAVIGVSGRFPDAQNIQQFWSNLVQGKDSVREIPRERWNIEHFYDPNPKIPNKSYSKWGALLDGIDLFDPSFFNISPREASLMDPQQRLFLQESWLALEDAGYSNNELQETKCGVFVGCDEGDYQKQIEKAGLSLETYSVTGKLTSILASRISYFLNLKGPSIAINTACSSSLVAIHLACESINNGTSDMAIAGGVNILTSPYFQIWASNVGMLSAEGKCKTFDNNADGFVQGESVAAVVLKSVKTAIRDGDHIYAVIKASGINQDGKTNGISAPSAKSQMELEKDIYNKNEINPETISYTEAHGTGTKLGDPIEFNALTDAFRQFTRKKNFCAIGSVKTNIGHCLAASGIASFIKVILCLKNQKLVPSLNFSNENEHINIKDSPFYINTSLKEWNTEDDKIRRAAISAFGFSGTNCHMIVDEFLQVKKNEYKIKKPWHLILFSAKTVTSLNERLTDFKNWIISNGETDIEEISYNLLRNRSHFSIRVAFVVENILSLKEKITEYLTNGSASDCIFGEYKEDDKLQHEKLERAIDELKDGYELSNEQYKKVLLNFSSLYVEGFEINYKLIFKDEEHYRISMPTYPFVKESYWISANKAELQNEEVVLEHPEEKLEFTIKNQYSMEQNIQYYIVQYLCHELEMDTNRINIHKNIHEYGVDSIIIMKLIRDFEERFMVKITGGEILQHNTVASLANYLASKIVKLEKKATAINYKMEDVLLKNKASVYPLSEGQKGLWMLQKKSPEMTAYNLPLCFRIGGRLDIDKLKKAFSLVLEQDPILTNVIMEKEGVPYQAAQNGQKLEFNQEDISSLETEEVIPHIRQKVRIPFDLEKGPLMRIHLLKRSVNENIILIVIHHIIFDGGSLLPFLKMLLNAYNDIVQGRELHYCSEGTSYSEFVEWERKFLQGKEGQENREYWKKQLSGDLPVIELPSDNPRTYKESFEGQVYTSILSSEFSEKIKSFSRMKHVNLSVIFLGILKILLNKYTGQEDICIGMPSMGRPEKRFDNSIGYFINMIVIRSEDVGKKPFLEFLSDLQITMMNALDHGFYPFSTVVRDLKVARMPGNDPIFQVAFFYQNGLKNGDYKHENQFHIEFIEEIHQEGEYEFAIEVLEQEDKFILSIKYNADLFERSTIARIMEQYKKLLTEIIENPCLIGNEYSILTKEDEKSMLIDFNETQREYPKDQCIHELFEKQANKTPHEIAVVYEGKALTYKELDQKSTQVALYLQKKGVKANCLVGIFVERSLEMIIGLIGILKAGGTYVPLDPNYPVERIKYILQDSEIAILLTQNSLIDKALQLAGNKIQLISIDSDWDKIELEAENSGFLKREVRSDDLAYVLYTSGSTGNPKGVMIPHRALTNFLISMGDKPGITSDDKLLAITTYCFDIAGLELYLPLVNGARVYICSSEKSKDIEKLKKEISNLKPTIIQATPVTWMMLFQSGWKNEGHLKIICGGEALSKRLKEYFISSHSTAWNMFGPTETTIWSMIQQIKEDEPITIGKPIANTQIYILDENLKPLPMGVPGELYIAGDGLAKGYFKRPELTKEKFIPNPFTHKTKIYKTGDLVRLLPSGNVEFLGRNDQQVKIRGYRIELGEIESRLSSQKGIQNSIVVIKEQDGIKQLVAYYIRKSQDKEKLKLKELREYLKTYLPDYMIPGIFIELDSIPLTPNGKVDRKKLINLKLNMKKKSKVSEPQLKIELTISSIWKEALHNDEIGNEDGFFEIGGDSFSAVIVTEKINKELNCNITVTTLFKYPNIKELSNYISQISNADSDSSNAMDEEVELEDNIVKEDKHNSNYSSRTKYPDYYKDSLAIIGISCNFPGAKNHFEFWNNLKSGVESVKHFSKEELRKLGLNEKILQDSNYVSVQSTIDGKDLFDPSFFNISPRDAEFMDPQFRLLMMHSWKAIEDAGYVSKEIPDTSVFISASNSFYQALLMRNSSALFNSYNVMENSDEYVTWLLNQGGTIPTMISHKLGLKGSSYFIHSNCSSSLVGLNLASKSLLSGECKYALVGAATVSAISNFGYLYQSGLNFSSEGHIKAFDASADGMVSGEGVATILLKRAIDAIEDGDHIYALVRGVSVNNDGADKVGFYAPSIKGQEEVIKKALKATKINPESIDYVEAHGTGTKLGDPIEFSALCNVYNEYTNKKQFCGLGSVKTNIGHLDTAAGLAGCIKVAMSLYHNEIPPSLNYDNPNPNINFEKSPFYVVEKLKVLEKTEKPHRAALSSFGIGGTNAHAIFEESPYQNEEEYCSDGRNSDLYIVPISAKKPERLKVYVKDLLNFLKKSAKDINITILEEYIKAEITKCISEMIGISMGELSDELSFAEQNIDYFQLTMIHEQLQDIWRISIDSNLVIQSQSIKELTENITKNYELDIEKYYESIGNTEIKSDDVVNINLAELAYTLQVGREAMESRVVFIVSNITELIQKLEAFVDENKNIEDCFMGEVKQKNDIARMFEGDQDIKELINKWLIKGRIRKLGEFWVKGVQLDWKLLYSDKKINKISLPTYPFAKEHFTIPEGKSDKTKAVHANTSVSMNSIHPLIQQNISSFYEQCFSSIFTGQEFFLADHVIQGQHVLPAVTYLEMARVAVEKASRTNNESGRVTRLKNVTWIRPIIVKDKNVQVNINLYPEDNGSISYEVYSISQDENSKILHSRGSVILGEVKDMPSLDLAKLQAQCNENTITSSQCYEYFRASGTDYGPGHRGIDIIYVGKDQVLAKLSLPINISDTKDQFVLHPSLMDAALQAPLGLMLNPEGLKPGVPFALQELEIIDSCKSSMWALVSYSEGSKVGDKVEKLDIVLCDDAGNVCVKIKGYSSRGVEIEGNNIVSNSTTGILLLEPVLREQDIVERKSLPNDIQRLVMLCEQSDILEETIEENLKGTQCIKLQSQEKGLEERFNAYAIQIFEECQNILKEKNQSKVLVQIVTSSKNEQQVFAGLLGILKTAELENPKLLGQLIEIDSKEDSKGIISKLRENTISPIDNMVSYQNGKRMITSLSEVQNLQEYTQIPWRDGGVYLITGGAGELGLIFAMEIAKNTKEVKIILTGRFKLSKDKQAKIQEIKDLGAKVEYKEIDVTQKESVGNLIESINNKYKGLNGIIHAAGVIRDNFIIKKTKAEFKEVLAPKVTGLINLDFATRDVPIDLFICFSSITSVIGNIGQADYAVANAFMDAYAKYRNNLVKLKQRYGKTLSINWQLWKHGGMHTPQENEKVLAKNTGMIPMENSAGIQGLYKSLCSDKDEILVLNGDLEVLRGIYTPRLISQEVAIGQEKVKVKDDSLKEKTLNLLDEILLNKVKLSPEQLKAETPFEKYGIDSIIQVTIINELEKIIGELPKTLLFEYINTKELVEYLIINHSVKLMEWFGIKEVKNVKEDNKYHINNHLPIAALKRDEMRFKNLQHSYEEKVDIEKENDDIAIIGISGRYPMSDTLEQLWEHLKAGENCITQAPDNRWENSLVNVLSENNIKPGQKYYGGFLNRNDYFDYNLFGISKEQAWELSPEIRLFLEITWETFENAGYNKSALQELQDNYRKGVGVFVGAMYNQYPWTIPSLDKAVLSSNGTDWQIANRTSHFFNLTGPSMAIGSACSSSLTAVHIACESLIQGNCSMAIAGGVNLTLDPSKYDALKRAGFLGSGNQSKSFGNGDGYIPGEGVGAVLLKPLSLAIEDGDRVLAVIKSSFANHSGGRQMYSAPDPKQQEKLIADCIKQSGINAGSIGYLESAANGSQLADPIEVIALKNAFKQFTDKKQFCAIGSVKSNLGHLEAASGISQLSKVILQLKHGLLVPTINADPLNPNIKLENSAFYLQKELKPWIQIKDAKSRKYLPRRSMINSFGAGGSYTSIIVEEFINYRKENNNGK